MHFSRLFLMGLLVVAWLGQAAAVAAVPQMEPASMMTAGEHSAVHHHASDPEQGHHGHDGITMDSAEHEECCAGVHDCADGHCVQAGALPSALAIHPTPYSPVFAEHLSATAAISGSLYRPPISS